MATLRDYVEYPPTFIPQSGVACMGPISWHGWPTLQGSCFWTTPPGREQLLSCVSQLHKASFSGLSAGTQKQPRLSCHFLVTALFKTEAMPRSGLTFLGFFPAYHTLFFCSSSLQLCSLMCIPSPEQCCQSRPSGNIE